MKINKNLSNVILIVLILFLTIFIIVFSINYLSTDKTVIKSGKEFEKAPKFLALMYETTPESGEYKVSTDSMWPTNGFAFNVNLSKCENGSKMIYDKTLRKVIVQSTKSDKCYVYFDKIVPSIANFCVGKNMASCIKTNYQLDNNINYHNSTLANGANDGSYRFSGANPNNYVCFGPGATASGTECPEENQFRIIGVFGNQVKLIKKISVGNRQWDIKGTYGDNTWSSSLINAYLNGEYLNSLTSTWNTKIASNIWQVGGMTGQNGYNSPSSVAFTYEVGPNKANITFNGKIALMYVSDYGFAAQPQAWTLKLGGYVDNVTDYSNPIAKANNWLFASAYEWTVSRISDYTNGVLYVSSAGNLYDYYANYSLAVRPVFYLESSINLVGGNGTSIDPYRIS